MPPETERAKEPMTDEQARNRALLPIVQCRWDALRILGVKFLNKTADEWVFAVMWQDTGEIALGHTIIVGTDGTIHNPSQKELANLLNHA